MKVRRAGQGTLWGGQSQFQEGQSPFLAPLEVRPHPLFSEGGLGSGQPKGSAFTPSIFFPGLPSFFPGPSLRTSQCLFPPDPIQLPAGQGPRGASVGRRALILLGLCAGTGKWEQERMTQFFITDNTVTLIINLTCPEHEEC